MYAPACLGGTNNELLEKYKITNGSDARDPADCKENNCIAKCSKGYANGSRLCGQCDFDYSHDGLSGECKLCPPFEENVGIAVLGLLFGILGLVVLIQLTLSDGGTLDESDGAKSIGLSFIQLISLLVTFPIAWPSIFTAIFQVGGAITVLGQHLVNLKCLIPNYTDADVFYGIGLTWGAAPPTLLLACVVTWHIVDKMMPCFTVSDLNVKIKTSCVALLYLLWPSLCSQTFQLFACRSVCDDNLSYLRADLDEVCWEGRHLNYSLAVGLPMLFGYVIGLPLLAFLRVRKLKARLDYRRDIRRRTFGYDDDETKDKGKGKEKEEGFDVFPDDHKIYGAFYSAFRDDTWWWESTVAARKIVIAMIGVFGAEMESMQVHFTIMLVVLIILATSQVRPFGGKSNGLLHRLEMFSLMATFLTLWAGSVFNTMPRCEDPDNVGEQMLWCDAMSVMVGTIDIMVVVAFVLCFVYLKVTTGGDKVTKSTDDQEVTIHPEGLEDGEGGGLSLSIVGDVEMVNRKHRSIVNPMLANSGKTNSTQEEKNSTEIDSTKVVSNGERKTANTNPTRKPTRKPGITQHVKRLSKVMKSQRQMKKKKGRTKATENDVEILVDESSGRRYSYNSSTGESIWMEDDLSEVTENLSTCNTTEVLHVEEEEEVEIIVDKSSGRRYSFNNSTGEANWID